MGLCFLPEVASVVGYMFLTRGGECCGLFAAGIPIDMLGRDGEL